MYRLPIQKAKRPVTIHGKTKTYIQMREEARYKLPVLEARRGARWHSNISDDDLKEAINSLRKNPEE